jgi:putative AbiEii toxin of type IV toxin-antitoxin system/AAA domain-containing protein
MLQRIHLKGVGPAPELDLEFAPRLNLLTGDNGLGKSFILDIAWWALTGTWAGSAAWPREGLNGQPSIDFKVADFGWGASYDFQGGKWSEPKLVGGSLDRHNIPSLVLYAGVDGCFSVWDFIRNTSVATVSFGKDSKRETLSTWAYHFSRETLWEGLKENGRVLCEGLIRDWVAWQRQETEAFVQLREILKILSPEGEELQPGEPLRVSLEDVRDHPSLEMPYERVPLIFASAGIKRVLSLAYLLVWAWQENLQAARLRQRDPAKRIIFLIDEIESHLHPKWQRLILPALLKVVDQLSVDIGVQVCITTHAPLVLASAEPIFDEEKDVLFTFDLIGRDVRVSRADWRDRGDASSWLTSDVFDLGEARSVQAEQAIEQAKEAMRNPELPIEEKRRIHHELRTVLKDTDPFWGRWLVQAKAAGIEP